MKNSKLRRQICFEAARAMYFRYESEYSRAKQKAAARICKGWVKPGDLPVRDIWPDGQQREFTFIYSACGCPVHVLAKRVGDKTVRVSDTPVIFPDDPAAVTVISRLMGW